MKSTWAASLVLGCGVLVWGACEQPISQIFVAGQYDQALDCISPGYGIDVIAGAPPTVDASCDATCIVPPFDSGVYATVQCPPYPPGDQFGPKASALCAAAVAALNRHDLCSIDGGPPSGPPADAGVDAGHHDAGEDAHAAADAGEKDAGTKDAGRADARRD